MLLKGALSRIGYSRWGIEPGTQSVHHVDATLGTHLAWIRHQQNIYYIIFYVNYYVVQYVKVPLALDVDCGQSHWSGTDDHQEDPEKNQFTTRPTVLSTYVCTLKRAK